MTPDEIAQFVGATNGAEILLYEDDEGDMPVTGLWAYARLSGNPIMSLMDDNISTEIYL